MKNRIIYMICMVCVAAASVSCDNKSDVLSYSPGHTKASLSIQIDDGNEIDRQEVIRSIRFVVFRDATDNPRLDVNEYREFPPQTGTEIGVTDLEVTANDDIMVIVIVNEPQTSGYSLKPVLDFTTGLGAFEDITYNIARILNSDNEIIEETGMPMVGVIRGISVATNETKEITMVVERAVARVDFYLEAIDEGAETGYTAGSTEVILHNATYESYFLMGNEANGTRDNLNAGENFGRVMQNVDPSTLTDINWTAGNTSSWSYSASGNNRRLLCSFYMAERVFAPDFSDRLALTLQNIKRDSGTAGVARYDIETITPKDLGTTIPFEEIRRNNVYEITARVKKSNPVIAFSVSVEEWFPVVNVDVPVNLPPPQ